jgi:pimeloyl-ACP methyl ester carboxylesterase
LSKDVVPIEIDGVSVRVAAMRKAGSGPPLVLLHGFGSTKEDYADLAHHPRFEGRSILAYDAPGCGQSTCADLSALGIPFLRETAKAVLRHYGIERFHLSGHSMGGLTALMLADAMGDAVLSFTNIEGNVAPEDCFLSRQILEHPADNPESFLAAFADRAWHADAFSSALFASTLPHKVRAEAVGPIFRSMVALSDSGDLLERFVGLPCPKMFVYGDRNRSLSYLGQLMRRGVQLAEIENCGHFPMYANPASLWARLDSFISQSEFRR